MRLFAHNHLGPRVYASFQNGLAYEYVPGKSLDYAVAVDKNVYPLVAQKVGKLHRRMIHYVGQMRPSHTSHHVFHTLRNWLMLVPMRLADPVNHQRMMQEMPGKATLVNELDELEVFGASYHFSGSFFHFLLLFQVADLAFSSVAYRDSGDDALCGASLGLLPQ